MIYMIVAAPRKTAKLHEFPNPGCRPEGLSPPFVINIVSELSNATDLALGKIPQRNAGAFVRAIQAAGKRSIQVNIDCAGGDGLDALAIASALLQHEFAVSCRIVGRCSSSAVFIALAADKDRRTIVADGYILVHASRRLCTQEQWEAVQRLAPHSRQAIDDSLNDIDDAASALLQARLGVSDARAREWLQEDRKWNAAEAIECGFVSAIAEDHLESA